MPKHFFDSHQLVVGYGTEHLARAAEGPYGDQTLARKGFLNEKKLVLFQEQAEEIGRLLCQKAEGKQGKAKEILSQRLEIMKTTRQNNLP